MKTLNQYLVEIIQESNLSVPTLSSFVDILGTLKYRFDDINVRTSFLLDKVGIAKEASSTDIKKLCTALQDFYDKEKNYYSQIDSISNSVHGGLSALFKFFSFEDVATKRFEPVKKSRQAAYDILTELINKYKGRKVSESILEAKTNLTPMENAVDIALKWKEKCQEFTDEENLQIIDGFVFWTIVDGLKQEGNTWAENLLKQSISSDTKEAQKLARELIRSKEYKMVLTGISKLFKQSEELEEFLDANLEAVDDEVNPSEWTLSSSDQKAYDSNLKKLEDAKKKFIDDCRKIK